MADTPISATSIDSLSLDGDSVKFKTGTVSDQIAADRYNTRRSRNRARCIRVVTGVSV